ncbi:FIST C-terminal domain-containing protein [Deltaproteobacteria bacterium OttesenSCG-928-K17]|nr:FIST C-terminal domain-containing protein [Deltaproteobacteria bacterium OttesenSCG-928-K17]
MRVSVGYCDHPDTTVAGSQAALIALDESPAGRCDFVLMFATSSHNPHVLKSAVSAIVGEGVPIIGGASSGAICNTGFGYAGDQVILAAFWLDESSYKLISDGGLNINERLTGHRLGLKLAAEGVGEKSDVLLFYDAINREGESVKLVMATDLLAGIKDAMGFLPKLVGAGLQGDYASSPTLQWIGDETVQHHAMALVFSDDVKIDTVIMHGCTPGTGYYTVTKADRQTILEINDRPALEFMDDLLKGAISPDNYAFFLILGINGGAKWGPFNERSYASRLCLGIDKERSGIVMFEPDMVPGTEFQIMYRSFEFDYMKDKIEAVFAQKALKNRRPVLATYINCAGRAGAFAGMDIEDAVVVQAAVGGKVPLLGLYSGVEIASVEDQPRGLDWTGVFSLISVPK